MRLNKEVTVGNLVSWGMILFGMIMGYATLKANTAKALDVANDAKTTSEAAKGSISDLKTDIAVIKVTTQNIERSIGEIKAKL